MAGAVETVTADFILVVIIHRKGIHISLLGHGLMESGIKNCDHGSVGHQSLAGINTDQVGGVVQRSKVGDFLDCLDDFVIDQYGGSELLAAMDDTMADCTDLVERLKDACFLVGQCLKYQADCFIVVGHDRAVDADSLTKTLGKECFGLGVDDLEFQ